MVGAILQASSESFKDALLVVCKLDSLFLTCLGFGLFFVAERSKAQICLFALQPLAKG